MVVTNDTSNLRVNLKERLRQLFHFRLLNDEQLEALAAVTRVESYEWGEILFSQGEEARAFYIVLEGEVKVYKLSPEGKEMILHLFGPGEMFAEVPIFNDIRTYPANSTCLKATQVLAIDGEGFRSLIHRYPDLSLSMLSVFAKRLHHFSELIEDLTFRTMDARLAKYLLSVSENSPDRAVIQIQKKTLAAILGSVPETLSRTFKKLSSKGLIEVEDNRIHLLDRDVLQAMADGETQ